MKVKIKLIDRNLIRAFGGVMQNLESDRAERLVNQGKAIVDDKKMQYGPPENKAIFRSPEDKIMRDFDNHRFPGPNDKLFPNIRKRK
jgi:hypothetical protein